MNSADFDCLADLLKRRAGLLLPANKKHLVASRLAPVARRYGFAKTEYLLAELRHAPEEMACSVTEAMMTNESSFFRDRPAFDHFRGVILPSLLSARAKTRRLRIWCAAASTGQEPYSLAMMLDEAKISSDWNIELVATDLCRDVIARAAEGRYTQYELQRGLTVQNLVRYFTQEGDVWRVAERLRRMVSFRTFNLLDDFGWLGKMDIVFCRNALLYFDPLAKRACLEKLSATLACDGYLLLGSSETMEGASTAFGQDDCVRGVYRKTRPARPMAIAG